MLGTKSKLFPLLLSFLLLWFFSALCFPASASTVESSDAAYDRMPDEYSGLLDVLPEEVVGTLPEELYSDSPIEVGDGIKKLGSFSFLFRTVLSFLSHALADCLELLASVLGILLLSAVANAIGSSIGSASVGRAFSFTSSLVILLLLVWQGWQGLATVQVYFERINGITAALLPLSGTLYAIGGNLGAATASSAGLSIFLTLLEEVVGKSILPFCGICIVFALIASLDPAPRVGSMLSTVKKNYTTVLAFLMMLLNTVLATQTTLGAKGDSLAMRSARFAAGNLIPVVGGSVTELLRSVGVGVGYLRTTVGICAILLLLLTLLPTLLKLYLVRFFWQIGASFAELLGCTNEKKLLDEFASLGGYLIAAVLICSSVMILSMVLLIKCATAIT